MSLFFAKENKCRRSSSLIDSFQLPDHSKQDFPLMILIDVCSLYKSSYRRQTLHQKEPLLAFLLGTWVSGNYGVGGSD
jgi:hypothetical protein